jgi:hypothetical protein
MRVPRWQFTATLLLPSRTSPGRIVLVAGGRGDGGVRDDAEVYDPKSDQWTMIPEGMISARTGHTATCLADGRVLLAGGVGSNGPLALAELFDPTTRTFAPAAPMLHARTAHVAMLMPDGRVLVAGGADIGGPLSSVEVYDPDKNAWLEVRPLTVPRREPAGTVLEDGKVLVIGGLGAGDVPLATAELFELFQNGTLCGQPTDCSSGFCVDGVCCDRACDAGACDTCSVRTEVTPVGAQEAGTCALLTGPVCDDGDGCTEGDRCEVGECKSNPKDCGAYACDSATAQCRDHCASINDCAPGSVCDRLHTCVAPPPATYNLDNTDCALAPPGAPRRSPWPPAALSLLALGAFGARRRCARPRVQR